jgi:hypothetical protein
MMELEDDLTLQAGKHMMTPAKKVFITKSVGSLNLSE